MQLESAYTVVVTEKLAECRDFYVRWFGFEVVFEASWFVYLQAPGGGGHGIAFMSPDHPSRPPGPESFGGDGLLFTLQVSDAAAEFERLRAAGLEIDHPLTDEPWGQRRFGLEDPAGTWVDVVQQIEPEPGWWERYPPPT
jgi:catechol 2,3-dioxygenase-like lactoylglutathione lyase family enzyme